MRESQNCFIAETDNGMLRIGLKGVSSLDTPHNHEKIREIADLKPDAAFEDAVKMFFELRGNVN